MTLQIFPLKILLEKGEKLLFTLYQTTNFESRPNWKNLQATIYNMGLNNWNLHLKVLESFWAKEQKVNTYISPFPTMFSKRLIFKVV